MKTFVQSIWLSILVLLGVESRKIASPTRQLPLNLQFFNDDLGVEVGEIADPAPPEPVDLPPDPEQQVDPSPEDVDQSKSFAKRLEERTQAKLAEERQKWEEEVNQKYGNYDQYQQTMDYVMQKSGYNSFEDFQSALEEAQLAERAEQMGVTPEYQQRLEELETRAKRADELEQQQTQERVYKEFKSALTDFSKEKGLEPDELESFMVENQIPNFEMAYRALRYEQMESDLKNAKDVAVKEYLESKKAPKVEGAGTAGLIKDEPPKNFADSRQRALERLRAARTNE